MNIKIKENGFERHALLLHKKIFERISGESIEEIQIELVVDVQLGEAESYQILETKDGWKIIGSDEAGLYYGIGKFLHSANWEEGRFQPQPAKLTTPASSFRAMYFAVHFYNWYQEAATEELEQYMEELLLYGYNSVVCIIPIINLNSFEDKLFFDSVEKTRKIFSLAKKLGMKVGIIIGSQGLKTTPKEIEGDLSYDLTGKVRGWHGKNVCPAKPGAMDYLRHIWDMKFEQYKDIGLDYLISWPYDEGGCGCAQCRPWGAKGYCEIVQALHEEAVKYYPNIKYIVSTWLFDTPEDEGEYEGFYKRLREDLNYVDYLMIDAHADFPKYPLEHEVVKPILNFPEISMWKLYPWGGRGANPLPKRFQRFWDSTKYILNGGMPYSEGMYEDVSKVQCVGYYWNPEKNYREILSEYISYEFSDTVCEEVLTMMELIEKNHVIVSEVREPDYESAKKAEELAVAVDKKLDARAKESWRWRILYIRAKLDRMIYKYYRDNHHGDEEALQELRHTPRNFLQDNEEAQELLQELCRHYHCVSDNGENEYTLPPVKDGIVKKGEAMP